MYRIVVLEIKHATIIAAIYFNVLSEYEINEFLVCAKKKMWRSSLMINKR